MSRKIKKKTRKRRLGKGFSIRTSRGFPIDEVNAFKSSGDFHFWLIHGLNYLYSDFEDAVWSPLYNIYEGKIPTIEEAQKKIQQKFSKNGELTSMGKVLGVWVSQDPGEAYAVYRGTLSTLKRVLGTSIKDTDAEDLIKEPHFGPIWQIFQDIKQRGLEIV